MSRKTEKTYEQLVAAQDTLIKMQKDKIERLERDLDERNEKLRTKPKSELEIKLEHEKGCNKDLKVWSNILESYTKNLSERLDEVNKKLEGKENYCKRLLKEGFDMQNKIAFLSAKNEKLQKQIDAIEDEEDKQQRTDEERSKDRRWLNRHRI